MSWLSNLPPPKQTEVEDEIVALMADWPRRKQLTALKYLYTICACKIDNLSHEISKAIDAEKREKGC